MTAKCKAWSDSEVDRFAVLRAGGASYEVCGHELGRTIESCKMAANRYRICGQQGAKARLVRIPVALLTNETDVGGEYTPDELEWMRAVQAWQKRNKVRYPAMTDYLQIARSLGYRKVT